MRAGEAENYLTKKGFEFQPQGDELQVRVCPFCGDEKFRFSLNKLMGLWQCFKCESRGNLYQLKEQLGDLEAPSRVTEAFGEDVAYDVVSRDEITGYVNQLWADTSALQYLRDRGLGNEIIKKFCLGVAYDAQGRYITFPYWKDGIWVNVKFRSLPPAEKAFKVKPKHEKPLYNCDTLKSAVARVINLVEGEIDCLSAIQMGFSYVVSLPQGAGNFAPDHWDMLAGAERINLVLDFDGAGREGSLKLAQRLGEDRCYNVKIPNGMDINDLLVKFGAVGARERLEACIADAKPVGKGEVASVFGALQELEDHITRTGSVEAGIASPWESVNSICGLIAPGEILLLQAIQKTGKTTFALQWLSWLAQVHKIPTLMYCLEMPLWRLSQSLVAQATSTPRANITTLEVKMTMLRYKDAPLYYGTFPKVWDFEHIKEVITYSVRRFGVQCVCFDNLQLLCRSVQNIYQEQAVVMREFKKLVTDLGISLILVVQPRKINPKSVPGMYDPSGTGSIIADADGMVSLWRKPSHTAEEGTTVQAAETESFAPETLVRVPASRYRGGGQVVLYFDGKLATFTELAESQQQG